MSVASAAPRLRADLVIRARAHADGTVFIVKDPAAGRFYRFREAECFIARQLDGHTTLDTVLQRVRERFPPAPAPETLRRFVASLARLGLLECEAGDPAAAPRRTVRGSLLYLRFRAFDPDRLLARLEPRLRFLFTRGFVLGSAALIGTAAGVAVLNREAFHRDLLGLWRFDALLLAWVTVLTVTAAHEFAHGLTCKHFGGEVREMGFMLIYFQPAFYCNVSDAWLFPERSRRLWVTFSGAYAELVIWALATIAWRLLEPDRWPSFVALIVMATSAVKSFFNLNPLIKLDGYYLLSDWLEIPNLRQKAMDHLGARFVALVGGGPAPGGATRRERRIFAAYGLLAGAYSAWLLGWISLRFGGFLVDRYRGAGFLLFGGFLMMLLRNPVSRLAARMGAAFRAARTSRGRRAGFLAAAAAAALFLVFGRMDHTVSGGITALPEHNADIEAEVEGFVAEVLVDEGQRVERGDVIARLSNRDLAAELERVEAEIVEKRADLEMRLARARGAVEKAAARLEYARKDFARAEALRAEGLIAPRDYDASEGEVALRVEELDEARAELQRLGADGIPDGDAARLPGAADERPDLARAELARLETRRRQLRDQTRLLVIVSPGSGVVTTPRQTLQETIGRFVHKGDLIAEVHETAAILAEIAVPEKDIGAVRPGMPVSVRVRAHPDRAFEGRVVAIAAAARPGPDGAADVAAPREKTFLVTTELDNAASLLKPGMTGHAKIRCGRISPLDLLRRGLAAYLRVEFWSWW